MRVFPAYRSTLRVGRRWRKHTGSVNMLIKKSLRTKMRNCRRPRMKKRCRNSLTSRTIMLGARTRVASYSRLRTKMIRTTWMHSMNTRPRAKMKRLLVNWERRKLTWREASQGAIRCLRPRKVASRTMLAALPDRMTLKHSFSNLSSSSCSSLKPVYSNFFKSLQ